jgi:plastocyanin
METYMDFLPENLTISVGDCVEFVMSETHNAVEVSQENFESTPPIGTALDGGFEVPFGETLVVPFDEVGTHFYVCQPHITMGMIGTIVVE